MRERERESAREKLRERENMKKMIESEVMMFGYEKQSFKVKQKSPGNTSVAVAAVSRIQFHGLRKVNKMKMEMSAAAANVVNSGKCEKVTLELLFGEIASSVGQIQ